MLECHSIIVIQESDQTRREMCEDCQYSRGDGPLLRCALKRNTACQHTAALRDRHARCPRGDEHAAIWQAAALDPPSRCGDTPPAVLISSSVSPDARGLVNTPPRPLSMTRGAPPRVAPRDDNDAAALNHTASTDSHLTHAAGGAESPIRIHQVAGRRPQ